MTYRSKNFAFALATAAASLLASGNVQAQNTDSIRGKCIDEVIKASPPTVGDEQLQRQRVQLYINCMQKHGLKP